MMATQQLQPRAMRMADSGQTEPVSSDHVERAMFALIRDHDHVVDT